MEQGQELLSNDSGYGRVVKKRRSRLSRKDITLPISPLKLKMATYGHHVDDEAPVFIAAVVQYLVSELLSISAITAEIDATNRITPHHLQIVLRKHKDLSFLLTGE